MAGRGALTLCWLMTLGGGAACSGDRVSVHEGDSPERTSGSMTEQEEDTLSQSEATTDADSQSGGAAIVDPIQSDQGSGGTSGEEALLEGTRRGPFLEDVNTELGNYNADLPVPELCDDLPAEGCAHLSAEIAGEPVELRCTSSSFSVDASDLRCEGSGFSLWLGLSAFTGAAPSSFDFTADPANHPIGFSYDVPWFESHDDDGYAISEQYEQKAVRTAGVRYTFETSDEVSYEFVDLVFVLHFLPRPTCPTCPEIRVRGRVGAMTGP